MGFMNDITRAEGDKIIALKRDERAARVPKEWLLPANILKQFSTRPITIFDEPVNKAVSPGILSKRELTITDPSNDATSIVVSIARKEVTCEEIAVAFCKRAAIALQLTNCISEVIFKEAIARAKELDIKAADPNFKPGPLHGLPFSVKDTFFVKGFDASNCTPAMSFNPSERDSDIVQILQGYGAIIFAKTTVPQGLLSADSDNALFGRTVNAYKDGFVAGGSTGGEGSLMALGATGLGIGSDGSGSVRMPALSNGVIGLRPSGYRWPLDGAPVFGDGVVGTTMMSLVTVTGPFGRSVRDIRMVYKLLAEAEPWLKSPFLNPFPWQDFQLPQRPIRIGVWHDFDYLHMLPPVQRGLELAEARLKHATGPVTFDTRPFRGPSIDGIWEKIRDWTEVADLRHLRKLLESEHLTKQADAMRVLTRDKSEIPIVDFDFIHTMNKQIATWAYLMDQGWNADPEQPLDALLWIGAVHPAMPFDKYTNLGITGLMNAIDWPAIILPLNEYVDGKEGDFDIAKKIPEAAIWGEADRDVQQTYWEDPERFDSLPLTVSLIGRRGLDENLLAIAEVVSNVISTKNW